MAWTGDLRDMKSFIDIEGASGSVYRFQRVETPRQLPITAGNFVFVKATGDRAELVCCGTAASLTQAREIWKSAVDSRLKCFVQRVTLHLQQKRKTLARVGVTKTAIQLVGYKQLLQTYL